MTTAEKLINRKLSLLELTEYLSNVSEACRIHGVSIRTFMASRRLVKKAASKPREGKAAGNSISRTALLWKSSSGSFPWLWSIPRMGK